MSVQSEKIRVQTKTLLTEFDTAVERILKLTSIGGHMTDDTSYEGALKNMTAQQREEEENRLEVPAAKDAFSSIPTGTDTKWLHWTFAPELRSFCRQIADNLGAEIEGTTLVQETAGHAFKIHAPMAMLLNNSDFGKLMDILTTNDDFWRNEIKKISESDKDKVTRNNIINDLLDRDGAYDPELDKTREVVDRLFQNIFTPLKLVEKQRSRLRKSMIETVEKFDKAMEALPKSELLNDEQLQAV